MTSPISPYNSEPRIVMSNASSETKKQIDAVEKEALEIIEHLPKQKQDQYKLMVRQGVNKIRMHIASLRAQGKTEYAISQAIITLVRDFKTSNDSFVEKNQLWNTSKEVVINSLKHNTYNLNNLDSNFGKIKRIQFDDESDDYEELSQNNDSQEKNSIDNHSDKKQLDTNTIFDPVSNFMLSTPPETIVHWTSELIGVACKSHPTAQKVCKKVATLIPESLKAKRPNALILTAKSDHNWALGSTFFHPDAFALKHIERTHNSKHKKISDIPSLCRAIDEEKANGIAIDLLIIRAHGERRGMQLDDKHNLTIYDSLPKNSCFQNLAPKAVIILESCSTGEGREGSHNIANHIANYSPKESTVFAPIDPINHFYIRSEHPLDITFATPPLTLRNNSEPMTYKIDAQNKKEAISGYTKSSSKMDENYISHTEMDRLDCF